MLIPLDLLVLRNSVSDDLLLTKMNNITLSLISVVRVFAGAIQSHRFGRAVFLQDLGSLNWAFRVLYQLLTSVCDIYLQDLLSRLRSLS